MENIQTVASNWNRKPNRKAHATAPNHAARNPAARRRHGTRGRSGPRAVVVPGGDMVIHHMDRAVRQNRAHLVE